MTGDKNEAQQIVADVIVERTIKIRHGHLPDRDFAAQFLMFAVEELLATQTIDSPILGGGHEPGARVVRDARLRPLLEGDNESILREIFSQADIAHDSHQPGNKSR